MAVDPFIALGRQRRAGDAHCAQRRDVRDLRWFQAGLHAVGEIGGAGAKEGQLGLVGEAPERTQVRIARIAVVDADGGADQKAHDLGIPHDPAGGGKPQEAVALAQVQLQRMALEVLDQCAAMAMHDGLGHAGGAGGIQDPQGMVERQLLEPDGLRPGRRMVQQRLPRHGAFQRGVLVQVRQQHGMFQRRQRLAQGAHHIHAVEVAAAVTVAIDRQQELGVDLAEAVQHAGMAHVGRAARPDGADAGAGKKGDRGFRNVGQIGHHPVARADAERAQRIGHRRNLIAQFAPGELRQAAQFGTGDDGGRIGGRVIGVEAKYLLGKIEPGAIEPGCARHSVLV